MNKNKILNNSGWWILSTLSLIPLILWVFEAPLSPRISNISLFTRSLGDVFGLCGMAMFSLVLILSARLKFFENFFNGINESYSAHHFFGGLAFCFLLFHPLLLAYNYLTISFNKAALFLFPGANMAQNFGSIGLFVMTVALVITFYAKLRYQVWKFTHKFLGLAFIFAFFHTFLIGADILSNNALRIYLFILAVLAMLAYFYRTLFVDYLVRTFKYEISEIKKYENKTWEISMSPKNKEIKFIPGQFVFIKFKNKMLTEELHPFSFSSADGLPLKIAVKELGDYTDKIGDLKIGDSAEVEGPFGAFSFKNIKNKKQIWVAGGIGIAPFLGMLRSLTDKEKDYNIDLYYSIRNGTCNAFQVEIKAIAEQNKNLNIIFWNTQTMGFLTADIIKNDIKNFQERDILICGPSLMMSALKIQMLKMGVAEKRIHIEEFQLY